MLAVVSETVGVPGQRGVNRHFNDLTAQRETAKENGYSVFIFNFYLFIFLNSCDCLLLPEDVLSDSRESWDVLIVDNICVQRRLGHQVRPRQGRVH